MGVIVSDKETSQTLNTLAREQMKHRLLNDILTDLAVCEIEGWDKREYLNDLKKLINSLGGDNT